MKGVLKDRFINNALVKPLYRKLKHTNKIKTNVFKSFGISVKLDGHGVNARGNIVKTNDPVETSKYENEFLRRKRDVFICNTCKIHDKVYNFEKILKMQTDLDDERLESNGRKNRKNDIENNFKDKFNKLHLFDNNEEDLHKVPGTWLRLYPAPKLPQESLCSVIFRCIFCQMGIYTFLVLWTTFFLFVIQYFEGPNEIELSMNFENQQKQLVIDLATELRQISPTSPRWKGAIKKRLEDTINSTSIAVMRGARLSPGHYWDLSGTFLFTVYVMTTLGFGAPLPQTIEGRTLTSVYATLAVPSHLCFLLNISTYIVIHMEVYFKQLKSRLQDKRIAQDIAPVNDGKQEHLNPSNKCIMGKKLMRIISILVAFRGIPLAGVLYYTAGVCIFGVSRHLTPLAILTFPIEFTTGGGLDLVECHFRVLYGFYVEGAMIFFACTLAILRRQSNHCVDRIMEDYRLFDSEK